jgi:glycosyltransferase involved in cell wall biosynthesis
MIESLACGTPVIACPSGSVPEIILDGRCGFIVRTIEQAVKAVRKIGEIDRRNCRRHFERNFTADRMAGEYLSIYERLIHPESDSITEKGVLTWLEVESPTPSTT